MTQEHLNLVRIDLGAIKSNLEAIKETIGPERQILAMVKGNAYGHGDLQVAQMIEDTGCAQMLGVACPSEAHGLRAGGIKMPILILTPTIPANLETAIKADVILSVCGQREALAAGQVAAKLGKCVSVHIKVDTGMGRVGVPPEGAVELANLIEQQPSLKLEGIMTHLPSSDSIAGDDISWTKKQIARFAQVVADVNNAIGRKIIAHCANSAAVLAHPDAWFDMVRPGVMIYGYKPDPACPSTIALKPAMSMFSKVIFTKKIPGGQSVSYGRTWKADFPTTVATIGVGYADGYNRLFSNKGRVLIKGRSYPVIGRVCMNMIMADVGADPDISIGDDVVLMGRDGDQEITCEEWAAKLGSIPYEVTCRIDARIPRQFLGLND